MPGGIPEFDSFGVTLINATPRNEIPRLNPKNRLKAGLGYWKLRQYFGNNHAFSVVSNDSALEFHSKAPMPGGIPEFDSFGVTLINATPRNEIPRLNPKNRLKAGLGYWKLRQYFGNNHAFSVVSDDSALEFHSKAAMPRGITKARSPAPKAIDAENDVHGDGKRFDGKGHIRLLM